MNEKTRIQIEEMKKQTIGVEVEMNSITREKAARIAAAYFRNRQIRRHSAQKRLQHLVGLGCGRQRVEISERREHFGNGQRKMRIGNADTLLQRH